MIGRGWGSGRVVNDVFWLLVACVVGRLEVLIEVGDPFVFILKV